MLADKVHEALTARAVRVGMAAFVTRDTDQRNVADIALERQQIRSQIAAPVRVDAIVKHISKPVYLIIYKGIWNAGPVEHFGKGGHGLAENGIEDNPRRTVFQHAGALDPEGIDVRGIVEV